METIDSAIDVQPVPPITNPFTVIVDTREQSPYCFRNFKSDASEKVSLKDSTGKVIKDSAGRTQYALPAMYIPTMQKHLPTGDYSIDGHESEIAVERKSLTDLYGTIAGGRDRFERELERLSSFKIAHIVVESDWMTVLNSPPARSKFPPKSIFRSINAWEQEFPTIHWQFMGIRALAEHKTFRILERFWRQRQKEIEKEKLESGVTS
jgi:ERCC4-type nuclease